MVPQEFDAFLADQADDVSRGCKVLQDGVLRCPNLEYQDGIDFPVYKI
jgi:hypothetical protein